MGRYKKTEKPTENDAPQFVPPMETLEDEVQDAQSEDNKESKSQEEKEAKKPRIIPLIASEDVPLHKGGVIVPTVINIAGFGDAIITSTQDNAMNGLLVEENKRLTSSFVVPMSIITGSSKVNVVVNVCEEVNILRQTQFGTRMDNLIIPAGTHVADLVLL